MGNLKGVDITKGSTGPNAKGPDTSPSLLLATGVAVSGKMALNTVYLVTSLKDAQDTLGITAAYDTANACVLHEHISEFYRMTGDGTKLWLMVVTVAAASPAALLEDTGALYAKKLIIAANGEARQLGFAFNVAADYTETQTDGLNTQIRAAISKAQFLADWSFANDMGVHIFLEGRGITATLSGMGDLRALTESGTALLAPQVSVVIGQDYDYAETRATTLLKKHAAIGTALGSLSAAEMNQSIAEVASFNLSNAKRGKFITGGLSNHTKIADITADLQALEDKSYIFPLSYALLQQISVSGLRWNNDHCCVPIVIDVDGNYNEHMIYHSRTLNMAARTVKTVLLLRLKSRVGVDGVTGKLGAAVVKNLEAECDAALDTMEGSGFIVEGKTLLNRNSDLITPPKTLLVSFKIVAYGILDNVSGTINLVKFITI